MIRNLNQQQDRGFSLAFCIKWLEIVFTGLNNGGGGTWNKVAAIKADDLTPIIKIINVADYYSNVINTLNQSLPGLFDKDNKLDENKLNDLKKEIEYCKMMAAYHIKNETKKGWEKYIEKVKEWKRSSETYIQDHEAYIVQTIKK